MELIKSFSMLVRHGGILNLRQRIFPIQIGTIYAELAKPHLYVFPVGI